MYKTEERKKKDRKESTGQNKGKEKEFEGGKRPEYAKNAKKIRTGEAKNAKEKPAAKV